MSGNSAWERFQDPQGRVFYVNHATREVSALMGLTALSLAAGY